MINLLKKLLKCKCADSKLLSIWWFAVLVVIGVGIVIGALIFFSDTLDVRVQEADILANDISKCLINGGYLDSNFNQDFDIFEECKLNESILKSGDYYLRIRVLKLNQEEIIKKEIGNTAFVDDCQILSSRVLAKKYPRCIERDILVLGKTGENLVLTIFAGSNYEFRLEDNKNV